MTLNRGFKRHSIEVSKLTFTPDAPDPGHPRRRPTPRLPPPAGSHARTSRAVPAPRVVHFLTNTAKVELRSGRVGVVTRSLDSSTLQLVVSTFVGYDGWKKGSSDKHY